MNSLMGSKFKTGHCILCRVVQYMVQTFQKNLMLLSLRCGSFVTRMVNSSDFD